MPKHMWIETQDQTVNQRPYVTAICTCGWNVSTMRQNGWLTQVRGAFKYHRQFPNQDTAHA